MPRLIKAEEVDSTNEWIKKRLSKLNDLDSFIAEIQNSGKGRNSKDWFSPRGGLWFSILLEKFQGAEGALSLLCATAVCDALEEHNLLTNIKWPNDIILKGKKLGGILIEKVQGKFIIGIGLNLNLSKSDFPIPLKDIVITSKETIHKELDNEAIAKEIIKRIAIGRNNLEEIHKKYLKLSGDLNEKVKINNGEEIFTGKVIEIQADGGIKIRNEDSEKVFYSGKLSYLS
ncbi:biotin--[acetyl-CoA-carboxylase] ligase [candidate division WOR-3 bacterium]|nr:biotin--[acetyl-CoA-carboxylase] ligase [candidate division WOR-3 bacterium]